MARLNKFASVNLNDSYGKPDRGGSASNSNNGTPSGSGKPRISSPGGMLVLSRPGRTQPPSPKPGQARLGIPSPVNLPSLKRETSSGETLAASPPIAGWSKGESPPLTGWMKAGESPIDVPPLHQKAGISRSLDTVAESLKAIATSKPDVYAPPAMRAAATQTGSPSNSRVLPPTPPHLEKPSAIMRGEEFPTLQAAVARPPTPPQHPRQKDLQQKQRDKQQEAKEQQLKLHQLSQAQEHKQGLADSLLSGYGNPQSQPPTLSLRPLGKPESANLTANPEASCADHSPLHCQLGGLGSNTYCDGSLSAQDVVNDKGSDVFADRTMTRSPPAAAIPSHGNVRRVDDAREAGHSFRPQYRSHLPANQNSPTVAVRQPGFQANSESSWLSTSRRDVVHAFRDMDNSKYVGEVRASMGEDTGRVDSEIRSASYVKESYFSKNPPSYREGSSTIGSTIGVDGEDAYGEQKGLTRESSDLRVIGRSSGLLHDGVPRVEGFHSQRSFVREVYNRDSREGNAMGNRESGIRDIGDSYSRDVRDIRENFVRDGGDMYDRDVKEAYSRDSRNAYTRDVREVRSQDSAVSKQAGYGYPSSNNGDCSWRGHARHVDPPHARGVFSPAGISPIQQNMGSVYDAHHGKQYGSQGMGDQILTREARAGTDPKAPCTAHIERVGLYGSNSEMLGSRGVRSPGLSGSSFVAVKEVHEVRSERPQRLHEEERHTSYEDKVMDVKGASNESHGSSPVPQRIVAKRDLVHGFGTRAFQTSINKRLDDEKSTREDVKKQLALEDDRRKEAARLKLLELEERIARRVVEAREEEVDAKGKEPCADETNLKQQDIEQFPSHAEYEAEGMVPVQVKDGDLTWGQEDFGSKVARPSSASSWTSKTPGEGSSPPQELESRLVGESESSQDRKMVRLRSPSSWRKEVGGGPTSKLFSSPYIESGGFRRPSNGGTYKLF